MVLDVSLHTSLRRWDPTLTFFTTGEGPRLPATLSMTWSHAGKQITVSVPVPGIG
jgi:hypothetical protein